MDKPNRQDKKNKVVVTAPLNMETASLSKAASVLSLPEPEQRQMDLMYMTAILVSTGTNKNGACFLGSELVKARATIKDKAVDIEHDERSLIGQITNYAFLDKGGNYLDDEKASHHEDMELDEMSMDVAVSCIVHAARFPELADEIRRGEWKVSMEAFYSDYDIKVGDFIIPRQQAENAGYDKMVGQVVKVKDGKKELGYHLIGRVLRGITFAGVGIVKNPANERSLILEAASEKEYVESHKDSAKEIDLSALGLVEIASEENKLSQNDELYHLVRRAVKEEVYNLRLEEAIDYNHRRHGTCVSFKKYVVELPADEPGEPATDLSQYPLYNNPGGVDSYPPGTKIVAENWCNLFDQPCTARPGDATKPECLRNVLARTVKDELTSYEEIVRMKRQDEGLEELQERLDEARKFLN